MFVQPGTLSGPKSFQSAKDVHVMPFPQYMAKQCKEELIAEKKKNQNPTFQAK